jgi:hypothetical protein
MGDIASFEKVWEQAIKAVSGLKSQTYVEWLRELDLLSLEDRRLEADMVQVYTILSDIESGFSDQWFNKMDNARTTRTTRWADSPQLIAAGARHNFSRGFFNVRVVEHWKSLLRLIKEASTIPELNPGTGNFNGPG